eukprot:GILJ01020221.1.p1 GENE.GILJ01020221.1~~GILJ01020221.1.p1  ORF type:complete len:501 (-),score=62.74 GILJ01020221.1:24-1460(-)
MAGQLVERGYLITDEWEGADAYLINSCTVKNPSESHFVTMLKKARDTKKPVIVAGCVPQGDPTNKEWADVSVIGVRQIDRVAEAMAEAMQGNVVRYLPSDATPVSRGAASSTADSPSAPLPPLDMPKIRRNKYIEIIPINVGCLNNCTYCKTKAARGDLRSWPVAEIVERVRVIVAQGVREIRLTSEDTGAYGLDIGTNAADLIREVAKVVEGTTVMVRIGMSNPPYLLQQLEPFAAIMRHPNVYEFLHLPVQAGSNSVLDAMKREYTVEEFVGCVETLREQVPGISIATDVICAFPGEGEQEWQDTMKLCKEIKFPVLNISRFYSRKGTPAAAMPQIPSDIAKRRTVEITNYFNSYSTYDSLLGSSHEMISLLEVAHDGKRLVGHTKAFVQVLVSPDEAQLGDCVDVLVTSTSKFSVMAKVTSNYGPILLRKDAVPRQLAEKSQRTERANPRAIIILGVVAVAVAALAAAARYRRRA